MRVLIKNGLVIDPRNSVMARLNVLLDGGKVADVTMECPKADMVIDAEGKAVTPGFIDIHMHEDHLDSEGNIIKDETAIFPCMLRMGVTSVLAGECGINRGDPGDYLDKVDNGGTAVNVAMLAGHAYIREACGHMDKYTPVSDEELCAMEAAFTRALDRGCFGISYGIRYVPGIDSRELKRTAALCKKDDKLIAAHIRDDAEAVFASAREFIDIGAEFGLSTEVSHIGSMAGFGQMEEFLRLVDEYRMKGVRVSCDCYPYYAFSTSLGSTTYDDGWLDRYHCGYDVVELCEGKYKGQRCTKEIFDEVRRDQPECLTVCYVMRESDVDLALRDPNVMLGSDGIMNDGQGHPRAAGAFLRLLSGFVRTGKLPLYDAISKMTAMPAEKMGLANKGTLRKGADADVVIFDPKTVEDEATFEQPTRPGKGIDYVFIGGEVAVKDCRIVRGDLGRSIRK